MKQKEDSKGFRGKTARSGLDNGMQRALAGLSNPIPPIWLMRQAGRYLPEYRALRAKAGSFLDLCLTPSLATEVTLQPIMRFDFDAAILFSDILVVPYAFGRRVEFVEGEGPRLEPIDEAGILALQGRKLAGLEPVIETVASVRARLDAGKSLIGFCGAPWTVATYMVAGHGTLDQAPARLLAARNPELFQVLIDEVARASVAYLAAQIRSGADVVQIFDSWAGVLGEADFERWVIEPTARIVKAVREAEPTARIIGFPKGAGFLLERYVEETGIDAIGIDWTVPLGFARQRLQNRIAVQGNLDPLALMAGGKALDGGIERIRSTLGHGPLIFNLGHGVLPETPIENVERLVAAVRGGV